MNVGDGSRMRIVQPARWEKRGYIQDKYEP